MGRAFTVAAWLLVAVVVLPFAALLVGTGADLATGNETPLSPARFLFLAAFVLTFAAPAAYALLRRRRRPAPAAPGDDDLLTALRDGRSRQPRISLWKARPFLPAPYGTRTEADRPACPLCTTPAETVRIVPGTLTLLPCGHAFRVRNLPEAART
ncbi:hypothetical protein [Spirillospora sp. NPDC047279]|uniref:hypothetical protein n=1 Tax=Spirillospora sp. NPDC047279 TaxID=3155478 RepID=UPI00340404A1